MENTLPWGGEIQTQEAPYHQISQQIGYQTPYYTYEPATSQQYEYQDPYYSSQHHNFQQPAYQNSYYDVNSGLQQYAYQDPYYSNQYTYLQQPGYQYPYYSNEFPSSQQFGNNVSYYPNSNEYPYTQQYAVNYTEQINSEVNKNKKACAPLKNNKREIQNKVLKGGNQTTDIISKRRALENRPKGSREGIRRVNLQSQDSPSSETNRVSQRTMVSPRISSRNMATPGVPQRNAATLRVPPKNTVTPTVSSRNTAAPGVPLKNTGTPVVPPRNTLTPGVPPKSTATPGITAKSNATPVVPPKKPSTHEMSHTIAPKKVLSKIQREVMSATAETVAAVKAEAAAAAAAIANSVRRKLPPARSLCDSPTRFFASMERSREERQRPALTLQEEALPASEREQSLNNSPSCFKAGTAKGNLLACQSLVGEKKKNEILSDSDISAKFKYISQDCKAFVDFLNKMDKSEEEESSDATNTSNTADERKTAKKSPRIPDKTTSQKKRSDATKKLNQESGKKDESLDKRSFKNALGGKSTSLLGNARRFAIKPKITKARHIGISKRDNLLKKSRETKVHGVKIESTKVREHVSHDKGIKRSDEIAESKENVIASNPTTKTRKNRKINRIKQNMNQTDDESSASKLNSSAKSRVKMTTLSQQRCRVVHENLAREKLVNERSQQLRAHKSDGQIEKNNADILPFSIVHLGQEPAYYFAKKLKYENFLSHSFSNMRTTEENVRETNECLANNVLETDTSFKSSEMKEITNVKSDISFLPPIEERPTTERSYRSLPAQGSRGGSRILDVRMKQRTQSDSNCAGTPPTRFAVRSPSNAPRPPKNLANALSHPNTRAARCALKDPAARLPPLSREKNQPREGNGKGSSAWGMPKKLLPPIIDKLFKRRH